MDLDALGALDGGSDATASDSAMAKYQASSRSEALVTCVAVRAGAARTTDAGRTMEREEERTDMGTLKRGEVKADAHPRIRRGRGRRAGAGRPPGQRVDLS